MVEIHCKISQNVLPKLTAPLAKPAKNAGTLNKEWDLALPKALAIMISRYMTKDLGENMTTERELRKYVHAARAPKLAVNNLVIVLQEGKRLKLSPKWKGPFYIQERVGRLSFRLCNLDGRMIPTYTYHEDALKLFRPRTGAYLGGCDDSTPGRDVGPPSATMPDYFGRKVGP
ncbi:hypothetical protein CIB48_g8440 [Xylaria polymorpha]|nr:hypothetical protein CIB48_g8440 [Xylaria polymorpha]